MNCACNLNSCGPIVARWRTRTGYSFPLCQACLDTWFDSADDDESLEPASWSWIRSEVAA